MGGRGRGGRPKKDPSETYKGKRLLKAQQKAAEKERKAQEKQERRELWGRGLCKGPDGRIGTFSQIGKEQGSKAWNEASETEKEQRKEAGRQAFDQASVAEQNDMIAAGRNAFQQATEAEQEHIIEAGASAWNDASKADQEQRMQAGREAWETLDDEEREVVKGCQDRGREVANSNRREKAYEKYNTPGTPPLIPDHQVWKCEGFSGTPPCQLDCVRKMNLLSFVMISDFEVLQWLSRHQLMDHECHRSDCDGEGYPVALGNQVGLKCEDCGFISVGGLRGFWSKGRLGITKMVLVVYAVVTGLSYSHLVKHIGVKINKNTWTRYVKDVGMVCAEQLERNRRDPENKYKLAQWDETAFGKRKYERGPRVRQRGVQWGLTVVEVDPLTNKTLSVDLQFLPYNRRDSNNITPLIVQRMEPGGTIVTDMWRSYPAAAEAAGVKHLTVNHSKEFKNPETGACTNNCEGIHAVIKKDAHQQFGRLPYLTSRGETYYLDLLVFRANARLYNVNLFQAFCNTLYFWTNEPLEGWSHIIPVFEEDEDHQEEEDNTEDVVDEDPGAEWFIDANDVEDEDIVDDRDYEESDYKRLGAGEMEDEDFVER